MRKLFFLLLVSAVLSWGYAIAQVVLPWLGWGGAKVAATKDAQTDILSILFEKPAALDTLLRDPFLPPVSVAKPVAERRMTPSTSGIRRPQEPIARDSVPLPQVVLQGILEGAPPVAILQSGGGTELARVGDVVWGLTVARVGKGVVELKAGKRAIVLTQ